MPALCQERIAVDDYLTTTEAAAKLGVIPRRVRRLVQEGRLPGSFRHGWAYFIPKEALEKFQKTRRKYRKSH